MGEKKWNTGRGRWEIDGIPVTYRVTWRSVDSGGEQHTRDFSDVDQGYFFYQGMQKSVGAYDVTWDHVLW